MKYYDLADGAMKVSAITLGTMTFGNPVAFDEAVNLIHQALDRGINTIDTANMYEGYDRHAGSFGGVAEEIIGSALEGRRNDAIVTTKLGMKVGDAPEDEGISAQAIHKQLPLSLQRLKTDYIDIYYLHKYDEKADLSETLKALDEYIQKGTIRFYGISNFSKKELEELVDLADTLEIQRPVICQPGMSLLKQEALSDLIPYCVEKGIAVTPYQILQGGLLTGKYKRGEPSPEGSRHDEKPDWLWEFDDSLFDALESYEEEAEKEGISMVQYATRWALRQPGVVSAIVGVKNIRQIEEAIQAADF